MLYLSEKLNVQFVKSDTYGGLPQGDDLKKIHGLHKEHQKLLRIPRRYCNTVFIIKQSSSD